MALQDSKSTLLQWHPAFYAGIQIEFAEEAEKLQFENEHQLSKKPMGIDVLIIKKQNEDKIEKNIGRIFRKYNIIEYKSPEDYLSIDDFYKVLGYACFYKSDTESENLIKLEEITISYVCESCPRKLIKHLEDDLKYEIVKEDKGIYYIAGSIFPIQLILTSELSGENNFWLRKLTNNLKEENDVVELATEYEKNRNNVLYKAMMDVIVRANKGLFEEVKEKDMCDAIRELFQDEIEEAQKKAKFETIFELVRDGLLNVADAAKRLQISEAEVEAML
jgi:hypothetical protein